MRIVRLRISLSLTVIFLAVTSSLSAADKYLSHPPLRQAPPPSKRPLAQGRALYVDPARGDDAHPGSEAAPWQSINFALGELAPGDTLYLRGGVYYENVRVSIAGAANQPITIRSYPGEQAVIDAAWPEFSESSAKAWTPYEKGAEGEFRSTLRYPNVRDVAGSFGDSMIGLQTYYHAIDLRSDREIVETPPGKKSGEVDIEPLYCGPGMWYDQATGYIHCRLRPTHNPEPIANYRGETDPRKVPLVIAPLRAITMHVDGARHVRFQDLVLRGGGYTTVRLDGSKHVEFDNVTIWCGTYGMQMFGVEHLKILNSGLYGNVAPWTFRTDGSKRDYPGRPFRNLSRLNTHAMFEIDSGRESSVYATPQNDHWEIANCEFTDAHDGVYLGSINCRFHHNLIANLQDDGIYLSPMYLRHRLDNKDPVIEVFANRFEQLLTGLAFGGNEWETRDRVFIYRNVFDLRGPVNTGRPTAERPAASQSYGKVMGDHGSPPWPAMNIYHNTFVMTEQGRSADMETTGGTKAGNERRVFNNIYYHLAKLPALVPPNADQNAATDGGLYWSPNTDPKVAAAFFNKYRASPLFEASKKLYPAGSTSHSLVADPRLTSVSADFAKANDYRLESMSPAIDAGVDIPSDWPDSSRDLDKGRPDIGALPAGAPNLVVGRVRER